MSEKVVFEAWGVLVLKTDRLCHYDGGITCIMNEYDALCLVEKKAEDEIYCEPVRVRVTVEPIEEGEGK